MPGSFYVVQRSRATSIGTSQLLKLGHLSLVLLRRTGRQPLLSYRRIPLPAAGLRRELGIEERLRLPAILPRLVVAG